jgi:hypothetical protein
LAKKAADVQLVRLQRQRVTLEAALQETTRLGGDRNLEQTLQTRLRAVNKQCAQLGEATRMQLRAIAMERDEKVKLARAESKAQETRAKELQLLVDLRKSEAEIAKAKSKEAAAVSKAAAVAAKQESEAEARRQAQREEMTRRLQLEFAANLVSELREYLSKEKCGHERFERCQRLALHAARGRAGLQKLEVPRFWSPSITGLRQLTPEKHTLRLRAKSEVLYASPEFCWALFGKGSYGKEGKWTVENEPRYAFRRLVEKLMPGYFDLMSCRYGVDNLFAEFNHILDLAFVAANWRYTLIVGKKYYRCGLAVWPPTESKWNKGLETHTGVPSALAVAAAPTSATASTGASAPSHEKEGSKDVQGEKAG